MCKPPAKVGAGALLVTLVGPRAIVGTLATVGCGAALVAVAGSMLNAYVLMGLTGYAAITTAMLLVRRANAGVRVIAQPEPAAAPVRAPVRVLEARPLLALPASRSDVTYVVEQVQAVGSGGR